MVNRRPTGPIQELAERIDIVPWSAAAAAIAVARGARTVRQVRDAMGVSSESTAAYAIARASTLGLILEGPRVGVSNTRAQATLRPGLTVVQSNLPQGDPDD